MSVRDLSIFFYLLFTFTQQNYLIAQKNNLTIRSDFHYGYIIPEYKHFNFIVNKPIQSGEISLIKKNKDQNYWAKLYNYPETGLTLQFTSLGNKRVLGHELGLFPYVQFPFVRKNNFLLYNQFGIGIGYVTKKFDLETNYEDISIGSHINVHFNFKLGLKWKLYEKIWLNSGVSFTHFSNANMAEPNLGINLLTAFVGLNYIVFPNTLQKELKIEPHQMKNEFAFIYAAGGKHTRALKSTVYFTSSASFEYKHHTFRKFHFGGGFDLSYDSSTKTEMGIDGKKLYKPIYDYRTGFHLSQEIVYNRFSFILQEGFYVGILDQVNKSIIYNRAILRWKFTNHFLVHVSMRSHLHILDYPELGLGYYF